MKVIHSQNVKGRKITTAKATSTSSKKKDASAKSKKGAKDSGVKSFFQFFGTSKMIQVYGIIMILIAITWFIAMISSFFHFSGDASCLTSNAGEIHNLIGKIGAAMAYYTISYTFGFFSLGFAFLLFLYGVRVAFKKSILPLFQSSLNTFCTMAWFSTVLGCFFAEKEHDFVSGEFGNFLSQILIENTKIGGTIFILFALLIIIMIICYNFSLIDFINNTATQIEKQAEKRKQTSNKKESFLGYIFGKNKKEKKVREQKSHEEGYIPPAPKDTEMGELYIQNVNGLSKEYDSNAPIQNNEYSSKEEDINITLVNPISHHENNEENIPLSENEEESQPQSETLDQTDEEETPVVPLEDYNPRLDLSLYQFPPIDLLTSYESKDIDDKTIHEELKENAYKIQNTLKNFNIPIKDIYVTMGPTVTLYEIIPEDGIRISKIKSLEDDIALKLAALGIRIIAPIPGKGTIGIEVPNKNAKIVPMRDIISSEKFQNNKYDLPIGLGKTISNEPFVVDLAKMPHLLMAGATGQGKSVGLNAIITSLLYTKHPSELKFVLVDPKKVEFTLYSIIEKHYLAKVPNAEKPIITDTKKVVETLNSLCVEMDTRYNLLETAKVRNIKEYNAKFCSRQLSPALGHRYLPYIVLIIDEFGDLIITAGREVETPIARLAQLARAIGIHLIIATQRPSVNIITGPIKANFPARIAFRVTSIVDSRTILDSKGANQLVGKGDMLLSTGSDIIRLQCAFIDTPEVERITQFIEEQQSYPEALELPEFIMEEKGGNNNEESFNTDEIDTLFMEASRLVVESQTGSTSLIQRKLKLGFNRAGRIMDQLEEFGIVGPAVGSKTREVKVKSIEELNQIFIKMGLF